MDMQKQLDLYKLTIELTQYEGVVCHPSYSKEAGLGEWLSVYLAIDGNASMWNVSYEGYDGHSTSLESMISMVEEIKSSLEDRSAAKVEEPSCN